jgi:hypothetical protein
MRRIALIAIALALVALHSLAVASEHESAIPNDCPVTLPSEPRFIPPAPHADTPADSGMFPIGTEALFTYINSDGRWRGITLSTGTRNKSFWYRKDSDWRDEYPYQLVITLQRLDADGPQVKSPRMTNAIMGEEYALLTMIELPTRGCWQITGNYKGDYLSFVVWND